VLYLYCHRNNVTYLQIFLICAIVATSRVFSPEVVSFSTQLAICWHKLWSSDGVPDMVGDISLCHLQSQQKNVINVKTLNQTYKKYKYYFYWDWKDGAVGEANCSFQLHDAVLHGRYGTDSHKSEPYLGLRIFLAWICLGWCWRIELMYQM